MNDSERLDFLERTLLRNDLIEMLGNGVSISPYFYPKAAEHPPNWKDLPCNVDGSPLKGFMIEGSYDEAPDPVGDGKDLRAAIDDMAAFVQRKDLEEDGYHIPAGTPAAFRDKAASPDLYSYGVAKERLEAVVDFAEGAALVTPSDDVVIDLNQFAGDRWDKLQTILGLDFVKEGVTGDGFLYLHRSRKTAGV